MLKDKIKALRNAKGITQEALAENLGVSSQTVSKWERGLLSPDIYLLPKLALLFRCSIDCLFDMESAWGIEHRREFEAKLHELYSKNDIEGIYTAWIVEIELNPDNYANYTDVMLFVIRKKLRDEERIQKMLSLAEHAEKCCTDDDIRNEINRLMIEICSMSDDPKIKRKALVYYNKLPLLRHSREFYARYVMDDEEYREQTKKNIVYLADLAECAVRQLIRPETDASERLYYYKKAAALYEIILDGKFGGFYDIPLLCDYKEIASLLMMIGKTAEAREYVEKIFTIIDRHASKESQTELSVLLHDASAPKGVSVEKNCIKVLENMKSDRNLEEFRESVEKMIDLLR